jgi:hypothetical protein
VAESTKGDVREEEHSCIELTPASGRDPEAGRSDLPRPMSKDPGFATEIPRHEERILS